MILIDAIYINNGGGLILLNYLIEELEKRDLKIIYLIDSRITQNSFNIRESNNIIYQDASLYNRFVFYKKNKRNFSKIFILGNVPPPIKLDVEVFTYFHNSILFDVPEEFPLIEKIKFKLKVLILNVLKKNTDNWLLQSEILKNQFIEKFGEREKTVVLPFYPSLNLSNEVFDKQNHPNTYLYVSNAQENKNHSKLIDGFCDFYDKYNKGKLILTVSEKYPKVLELIRDKINKNYPIENLGFINRNDLKELYKKSKYVIFPSLAESFGLGIVEGIEFGCKVIASDLPFTYAVCEPSIIFNPIEINSISMALELSLGSHVPETKLKTSNQIHFLIQKLS